MSQSGLTEAEAKEKWCCGPLYEGRGYCLASACMAWRWTYPKKDEAGRIVAAGYCGHAGKP